MEWYIHERGGSSLLRMREKICSELSMLLQVNLIDGVTAGIFKELNKKK